MDKDGIEMKMLHCLNCGWSWYPRSPRRPDVCPSCKCREWDNENKNQDKNYVKIRLSADSELRNALKDAKNRGDMYKGQPITEELAFEIGAKYLLNLEVMQ